jgi:UDP-hydrolysing UDP-N-acetyl-D-glucosamine 2-epimerase
MKLVIAITNRSSYGRVKSVMQYLIRFCPSIDIELIVGSSLFFYKYGRVLDKIKEDFPDMPMYYASMAVEGDDVNKMSKSVGVGIIEVSALLDALKPDAVVTIADRFETMATAIAASYANIPLIHIQGGEVTGTIDDKVRNAITQLADYHFPATAMAKERIIRMKPKDGINVHDYGCPSLDLMVNPSTSVKAVNDHGTGDMINFCNPYIIVVFHPDTKFIDTSIEWAKHIAETVKDIEIQKIIFWNNIDAGGDRISKIWRQTESNGYPIRFVKHIDPESFGTLLGNAACIVGNSSAGIRESSFLGTPSVDVGMRQAGREKSENVRIIPSIRDKGLLKDEILYRMIAKYRPSHLYGDGYAGAKIGREIKNIFIRLSNKDTRNY